MQFNTYTSSGAHIAAALVNDPMTDAAAVGALLAGFDVEEPVPGEAELADLRDWTARLRSVFEPRAEAVRAELVNDLLVESDCRPRLLSHDGLPYHLHYRPLNNVTIEAAWDWRHKAPGIDAPLQVPNVALDLSAAMRRNPALRVYIMGGVYDLATPFAGAEFDISHLYLGERLRRNVQFSWYESGHMTFVDEKVIPVMTSDLARFYA